MIKDFFFLGFLPAETIINSQMKSNLYNLPRLKSNMPQYNLLYYIILVVTFLVILMGFFCNQSIYVRFVRIECIHLQSNLIP